MKISFLLLRWRPLLYSQMLLQYGDNVGIGIDFSSPIKVDCRILGGGIGYPGPTDCDLGLVFYYWSPCKCINFVEH